MEGIFIRLAGVECLDMFWEVLQDIHTDSLAMNDLQYVHALQELEGLERPTL